MSRLTFLYVNLSKGSVCRTVKPLLGCSYAVLTQVNGNYMSQYWHGHIVHCIHTSSWNFWRTTGTCPVFWMLQLRSKYSHPQLAVVSVLNCAVHKRQNSED